uniref:UORF1 n=1 Tax=Colletotrichum gloeosporioides TaxID=474922 RepID=A8JPF6_COLGL|nr:uORF1 [Colletotrichum gloeosporioides]
MLPMPLHQPSYPFP